jgi:hypothetical protein
MAIATVLAPPGEVTWVAAAVVAVLMVGLWAISIRLGGHPLARKLHEPEEDRRSATLRERWRGVRPLEPGLDLRPAGTSGPDRVAAAAGGCRPWRRPELAGGPRLRAVGARIPVRDRRRRAAAAVQGALGFVGTGDGHRAVALHPSPQLLRRPLRLVGTVAGGADRRRDVVDGDRPAGDDGAADARLGGSAAGARHCERRPKYADYIRRTSGFFPRRPQVGARPAPFATSRGGEP